MMRRVWIAIAALFFLAAPALAQRTVVSGTVKDLNGVPYSGATLVASLSLPVGAGGATLNGVQIAGTTQRVTLDSTGAFLMQLPDNALVLPGGTQWTFNVNISPGVVPPLGTGPQNCTATVTITGASQSVSSNLSACPALSNAGVGSATSVGPVINVSNPTYLGCSAGPVADYTTCFTSIATASAAASKVSVGIPSIRSTCVVPMPATTQTTLTTAAAGSTCPSGISTVAGDTVIVGVLTTSASGTFSVTNAGSDSFFMLNLKTPVAAGPVEVTVFSTGAGIAKTSSGVVTVNVTVAANYGFIVMVASNVGSFGQLNIPNTATSVTPTNVKANFTTTTTQDNNNIVATFIAYCPGSVVTISQNTGTLQGSYNGSATNCGGGLVTNTSATPGIVTTNATLSVSKLWVTSTLELRSVQTTVPTVYFPYQSTPYYYSSGLNFLSPVTLKGDPGSVLWYTGTAHAIDLGPNNLTIANYQNIYYTVTGLTFEGGGSMTQGIFINDWIILVEIGNCQFINFGNSTSWGVWANGDQNDIYMHDNKFVVNDGASNILTSANDTIIRHWVNITTQPTAITMRFVNNSAECLNGLTGNVGCSYASLDTPLISVVGLTHDISHNNFMGGFCPAIDLGANDNNTKISYNHFETQLAGCLSIAFRSTVNGLRIFNNYFRAGGSSSPIGPRLVGDTLIGATIRDNYFTALPAGVPIVIQNNLAGQINNLASGNMCESTSQGYAAPCPIIHTAGGNITPWNADYAGTCTMVAGACPVYNFLTTYTVAPKCTASWTGGGALAGVVKTLTSTTQLTITSSNGADTAVVNWVCNPDAQ